MKRLALLAALGCSLIAADATYLVLLKGTNALAYVAPDGKITAQVSVGQHPHEMVFSKDRRYIYTSDNGIMRIEHAGKGGNSLSVIDVASRTKIGDIDLGEYYRPHGIDLSPDTGMLVVTSEGPDQLLLVDPSKRKVIKHFDTKGKIPHMVTFGPGGKWAYVSNSGSGTVAAINVDSGETKVIPTGERPEGSVLSKDGKELYVANREAATITVIDTTKRQAIAIIQTGKGPVRIALTPDGSTLVYALMHERRIAFADPKQRRQTDYVLVPGEPVSCTLSHDGKLAFASAETSDTVYVISVATKKIVGELKMPQGSGPDPVFDIPAR